MPVGTRLISFYSWVETSIKPSDYYDYIYWYNKDGSRTFAPTSQVAYNEFKNPKPANIGFQEGKDTMIWNS